mgnify:CR=1 FL=1
MKLRSYDFLMNESFSRIKDGVYFDKSFNPYSKKFMQDVLEYFESREKYEECILLKDIIKKRFDHEYNWKR